MAHTKLDNVRPDIIEARSDLFPDEVGRYHKNVLHSKGVLRGQAGSCCKSIAAMGSQDSLVSLQSTNPGEGTLAGDLEGQ